MLLKKADAKKLQKLTLLFTLVFSLVQRILIFQSQLKQRRQGQQTNNNDCWLASRNHSRLQVYILQNLMQLPAVQNLPTIVATALVAPMS